MSDIHQVIFYPVGNGDTTQIILSAGRKHRVGPAQDIDSTC